jgi:dethiobiotin synthetase
MDPSKRFFISGIGTAVGKTVVAAILTEALNADYWKPVQAGIDGGTDSDWVRSVVHNRDTVIHEEAFRLKMPASPHIAARQENVRISVAEIVQKCPYSKNALVIEGAGGLMVPLNESEFVADLVNPLQARLILVSRNYLGSINHSLLTAMVCRQKKLDVLGWVFNDNYLEYEDEIANWSGYERIASIPYTDGPGKDFVTKQADILRPKLQKWL